MRISTRGAYGIRALFDLAQRYNQGAMQSDDIATRQGIPVHYLNQLLLQLRKAGLIESVRGPHGGHLLARAPAEITLLEALRALEGPLLSSDGGRDDLIATQPEDQEILETVWVELRLALEEQLQAVSLEDLCQRKREGEDYIMYYI